MAKTKGDKNSGYTAIANQVLFQQAGSNFVVSAGMIRMLAYLTFKTYNGTQSTRVVNNQIAAEVGLSREQVRRNLRKLEELGLIEKNIGEYNSDRKLAVHLPNIKEIPG